MSDPLIRCENLSVGYDGQSVATDIAFRFSVGEYLCVLGENGAGKTTLMKTLLGLTKPISGALEMDPKLKKGGLGYLPQHTHIGNDFPATVLEVVLSGVPISPWYRFFHSRKDKEKALQNLAKIGAEDLKNKCFNELSGGQRQRVLLARALCSAESALLVDEPVSGLDPLATQKMYETLDELHKEGMGIIMITHDVSDALAYATHVLLIDKEPFFGTVSEFKQSGLEAASKDHLGGHDDD
ncbi:MAG: ABC transporter ATP-binding protein [Bacilli bacterium]|nr:ABC transporter ATP-binding protein [Bacilli bacterium]